MHRNTQPDPDMTEGEDGADSTVRRRGSKTPRHYAMDLLARREYSRRELLERLHKRFPDDSAESFADVIDGLAEEGLQSDQRFAESYIRLRVSRGHGPLKIAHELLQRGIEEARSAPLLEAYDWYEQAQAVLLHKFGHQTPRDLEEKARMARFMNQRGFGWEHLEELL